MGEDTPDGGPIGDPCGLCNDILWLPGKTPRFLKSIFFEIVECFPWFPPVPNGEFIVEQDGALPCYWKYEDADYFISYRLTATYSHLAASTVQALKAWTYFYDRIEDTCKNGFTNANADCLWPHCGKFGTAVVVPV